MPFKRRLFFVLLFIISFSTSVPNESLETVDKILDYAPGTDVPQEAFNPIKPAVGRTKFVKCKKLPQKLNTVLHEQIL